MTNAITIKRDDLGNFVIESDCWGVFTTETQATAIDHIRRLFEQLNVRIESLRKEPEKWSIKRISELPS